MIQNYHDPDQNAMYRFIVDGFDIGHMGDMGNKFSTYARDWIKQTINRYVDEQHTIKIPEYLRNKITRIRKAQNNYLQAMGQEAPISILASECEMSENEVEGLLSIKPDAISLNKSSITTRGLRICAASSPR